MTRHRPVRGTNAPARGRHSSSADTVPFALPTGTAPGRARHRSPARSALRSGIVTAGVAGGALAVGAATLPMLSLGSAPAPTADLALSTQSTSTGPAAAPVTPAAAHAAPVGAASSDLAKAVDRHRRAEADRAAKKADAARAEEKATADRAAAAAERERAKKLDCGVDDTYGGVADGVQTVGNALQCVFPGHDVGGVGSRGNASDHPDGYAIDFMTDGGSGSGDAIAECVMDNQDALGVSYAIWNQRINTGSGWKAMEDRGGRTANHEDHVHISFEHGAKPDVSALRGCGGAGSSGKA